MAAQAKFPTACDPVFVDSWTQIILARKLKNKTPLPADFTRLLSAKVEVDLNIANSRAQQAAVNLLDLVSCVFASLILMTSFNLFLVA